ncbi:MAG TPA: NADH-quinone oxidoreductase subunit H [Candidatus Krumholzibacteria bacterium]|nr:NADH-quinone oxidoreductase subunit H [Candidatus Krumholzibacteria bacterium]
MRFDSLAYVGMALLLAPLLQSVIHRTKAQFAGRRGRPWLQPYHDLAKLLRKGAVYSRTTTWVFRAGPIVGLAAVATALCLLPHGGTPALLGFSGDLILWVYLLGLGRFATAVAAVDTGSSFEGMGASREVAFAALAEPVLLLGLLALARQTGTLSLSGMIPSVSPDTWSRAGQPVLVLAAVALFVVLLVENARIPFDDPNTHLELTMIHEAMVLDHGGPDLALVQYGAALKLWALGALVVGITVPCRSGTPALDAAVFVLGMVLLAVVVGIIESTTARLRLLRVPQFLTGAGALAALALLLTLR